jgi:hypothetical protein
VVRARRGISKLGCLFTVLLLVAAGYFGLRAAESYFRYLKFKDAMSQEVRFRGELSDESIKQRLRSVADSLGLPPEAGNVKVTRNLRVVTVESEYDETIELPGYRREVRYSPRVSSTF